MHGWFRLYSQILDDPDIQGLDPALFKHWINLLCACAKREGNAIETPKIAFALRIETREAETICEKLLEAGLLEKRVSGYRPKNWDKWQYKSDTSTERVKRFRKRRETVTETVPEYRIQNTEQIRTEKKGNKSSSLRSGKTKAPEDIPVLEVHREWAIREHISVDLESETQAMLDWARGKGELRADWEATRRNWWRNAQKRIGGNNGNGRTSNKVERTIENAKKLMHRLDLEDSRGGER